MARIKESYKDFLKKYCYVFSTLQFCSYVYFKNLLSYIYLCNILWVHIWLFYCYIHPSFPVSEKVLFLFTVLIINAACHHCHLQIRSKLQVKWDHFCQDLPPPIHFQSMYKAGIQQCYKKENLELTDQTNMLLLCSKVIILFDYFL